MWERLLGYNIFRVSDCACNSGEYKNYLSVIGMIFIIPNYFLYKRGFYRIGGLTTLLLLTTVVYHITHKTITRAFDIITVFSLSLVMASYLIKNWKNKVNLIILSGCLFITVLAMSPYTRDKKNPRRIRLPWHIFIHVGTSFLLTCLVLCNSK